MSVTDRIKKLRSCKEYREWRKSVIERDVICVLCGSDKQLEVDHIKSLALNPHLALDINNGRVLCKECHKKTDTYGSLSKFKNEASIHPILTGDLLYKIKSLPSSIEINKKNVGFSLQYEPSCNKWIAGYKVKKIKMMTSDDNINGCIDKLFKKLKQASTYDYNSKLNLIDENNIKNMASKILRKGLYNYVEKIIERPLNEKEKKDIISYFSSAVKEYFNNTYIND